MKDKNLLTGDNAARDNIGDDREAAELRGFGPVGILGILAILSGNFLFSPLSAILVLFWVRLSRTPWRELGFVRPDSWVRTAVIGIVFGAALKFLLKAIVMPLIGAPPINSAYHYLAGNRAALPGAILAMIFVAGFGEETVYRGYMFERLGKLLGDGPGTRSLMVMLTAGLFGAAHYSVQGLAGAEQAVITGLVFGTVFALTKRIWMVMFAHAAYDLAAVAMIYWSLESTVAHLIFK